MRKKLSLIAVVLSTGLLLGGCSLLNSGPPRDAQGRVTERATISAQDLKDKDCFTFNSADGGVVEQVTVMPCTDNHEYLVIAQGTLTPVDISSAGSLQNAVSVACSATFDLFKSKVKDKNKPKQEFLVFPATDKKNANQLFSCIATDPDQNVARPSPTPTPAPTQTP